MAIKVGSIGRVSLEGMVMAWDGRLSRLDGLKPFRREEITRRPGRGLPSGRHLLEYLEDRCLLSGTITGLVFEDYNGNGTYDTTSTIANAGTGTTTLAVDQGIAGVKVTAYDNSGVTQGTSTTATDGTYSLITTGTGPYRVVFTNLPAGDSEGPEGPNSGSTVQIVPNGNSSNISLGVSVPNDYSPNNPIIATNQYILGDPINGPYANSTAILGFPYSSGSQYGGSGSNAQPSSFSFSVPVKSVGATFGLTFNPATGTLYAASYTKRFAGYGPNATGTGTTDGAIYAINPTTGAVSTLADLNTIFGANTAGVDFRSLSSWTGYSTDGGNTGWDAVGKTSLGGMAISPDGSMLYVMNLADRNLYAIPTSGPINASTVKHVSIPFNAPGATGTANGTTAGDLRPFAVTYYDGQIYVGIVNSAQSTQNAADLKAYVYTVNPTTLTFSTSPVFQTSLNYARGNAANFSGSGNPSADWNPWSSTFMTHGQNTTASYAQPMLSGIAFDASGNMVLGLRDRSGDETGFFTDANPANPTQAYEGISAGDTLRAFINTPGNLSSGWTLENDGRGPSGQGAGTQNTNLGPGGASFYYQQNYTTFHSNVSTGGVYELPGFNDVITSSFDPGTTTARTGGVRFLNNTTGATDKSYQIYNTGFNAPPQATFGKAAGIGDVTAITSLAPIEIGDRVFLDLKDDGLQDPGDPGIAGVTVHLYKGSTLVGTTVTSSTGNYLFNASDVPGGLLPNTAYQIRFDNAADFSSGGALYGKVATIPNADPAGLSGSKAIIVNGVPVINETTGAAGFNDHSLDAGFVSTGSVSGNVFNDTNDNGVQDNGETSISGVTLTLTGTNDLGNAVSVTATTDSSGNFVFSGLRPSGAGGYTIAETLPTGELVGINTVGTLGGTAPAKTSVIQGITVTPSATGTGYEFANLLPASLAGYVYSDANDDGVKQSGEAGIAGVMITLTGTDDEGNAVDTTTTTLGDGSYSFPNLRPSNSAGYTITEVQPAAYLDGKDTIGTPGGTVANDVFSHIVLTSGVSGVNNNFGELAPASLAGRVYFDANDDGVKENSEPGIAGVTVTLTGTNDLGAAVSVSTMTAADGTYSFANLRPSNASGYSITETPPSGYLAGTEKIGSQGGTVGVNDFTNIVLAAGVNGVTNDFGELEPSSLGGYVYVDTSDDGAKESGEPGINGVTVTLTGTNDQGGTVNATATTGPDGSYLFSNLRPSNASGYTITETQPAGYLDGKDTIGTPGGTTSNDAFSNIVLASGITGANNNFGELQPASLSGYVYIDANGDGLKQTTEAGINGVAVTLTGKDDLGNSVSLSTHTASDGSYSFTGLRPSGVAGYTVTETPPTAYTVEKNNVGTAGGTLSGSTSIAQIGITSGATATRYYFGETGATISGTTFLDANDNGVDDNGESGLAGVTVTLENSGSTVIATTTSAANGTYSFANLPAANYTVIETQPSGYGASTPISDAISLTTTGQTGLNFGITTSTVSGLVFTDVNGNGTYDQGTDLVGSGESLTLTGTDVNDNPVNLMTTTASDGSYSFTGLLASNSAGYTVTLTPTTGETPGTAIVGTAGGTTVSGNDEVTGIVLPAGTTATGYQYPQTGTVIQGLVYVDTNQNGTPDPGEPGLGGVTITLAHHGGGLVATTTTDSSGSFTFAGYPAGSYDITETTPTGYGTTTSTVLSAVNVPAAGVKNENFGLSASSLSGTVYNDYNADGTLDPGDPGIAGVTLTLINSANSPIGTTTTSSTGTYSFLNLPAGTYTIQETQPAAYGEGQDSIGSAGGSTSVIDVISQIQLPVDTAAPGYNFGERGATISGEVYLDSNDNNTIDPGELGLAGVTVDLLSSGVQIASTTSASNGDYSFANLPAGNYTVHEERPLGYGSSSTITRAVTLPAAGTVTDNFGLTTASLSGTTYLDLNDDGTPEAGEPPIEGVTLTLIGTDANGKSVIETTTTDVNGNYTFAGLLSGTYSIAESQPTAYRVGKAAAGTSGGTVGTDLIDGIGLGAAVTATGYDFGSLGFPVSGTVFVDANDDGVMEPGENGLGGVPLTLSLENSANQVVATTTSGSDGTYSFSNVVAGSYTIVETPPSGYGTSTPTAIPVTVTDTGLVNENFGVTTSSISGLAYLDVNKDNVYTPGVDVPGAGLTITLTGTDVNHNAVDLTTKAAADGTFTFSGLLAGTYNLSTAVYPGVNQEAATAGTAGGTVTGLDDITSISLPAGQAATGYLFPGTGVVVSGTVYNDGNRDGTLDNSETGVPGVTVTLTGENVNTGQPITLTTTTDASGNYVFPSAAAENGTIAIAVPTGYAADTPTSINKSIPSTGLTGQNFGLTTASIAGTIFADNDDDGILQAQDGPIANVVLLLSGTDTGGHAVNLSTVTAADGSYLFTGLNPGTYTVTKIPPSGYLDGIETPGTAGATVLTDALGGITLATGQGSTGNNFAELVPASLAGTVFIDASNDGNKDPGEPGILGVTVTLTGVDDLGHTVNMSASTRASGNYSFTNLRPSNSAGYTITETPPTGYLNGIDTVGTQGGTLGNRSVTGIVLAAGVAGTSNNFAELSPGTVSGTVYVDANDNRVDDPGEAGVAGVTITLTGRDDLNDPVNLTTTTASDGTYSFGGLRPSNSAGYTVTETAPNGYLPGLGVATSTSSNGVTTGIVLPAGGTASGMSFPELLPASLSGYVYQDLNDGGAKGQNEPGIAGVKVTLTGFDDQQDPVNLITTTDANGFYSFTGLRPALNDLRAGLETGYTITETQPSGYLDGKDAIGTPGGVAGNDVFSQIPLVSGFAGVNNDFGELPPASLSGFVYVDANNDGIKQVGEAAIPGVTVTLTGTDDLGDPISLTTTTDANGAYSFTQLRPSSASGYSLSETQPSAYLDGKDTIGTQGGSTSNDHFGSIVLAAGTSGTGNNFGELLPASLSGFVYSDTNDNGIKQAGEAGLPGVTVTLTGVNDLGASVLLTTTTAADGSYSFTTLRPSNVAGYTLTETPPAGYLDGKDSVGTLGGSVGSDTLSKLVLASGSVGTGNDFANLVPASLAGFVYLDANKDGVKEAGLSGVLVTLTGTDDRGQAVKTFTSTAANGSYNFAGLRPGTYTVSDVPPSNYVQGVTAVGTGGGKVSGNAVSQVSLGAGVAGTAYNFGETGVSITGSVYSDTNGDGQRETGEPGIGGVTITLLNDQNQPVGTTLTAADGSYSFTNLMTENYTVVETPPTGTTNTSPTSLTLCLCDTTTGLTGENFGLSTGSSLSGYVYVDDNNDGVKEAGEKGLAGSILTLTGTNNINKPVTLTTTTASDGSYHFVGLLPGTYTISGSTVSGYANGKETPGSAGGSASTSTSDKITGIVLNQGVAGVNYDFGKIGATLTGTVLSNGLPVAGASVTVFENDRVVGTAITGPNGTYSVVGLPVGTAEVVAMIPGPGGTSTTQSVTRSLTGDGPAVANFQIVSASSATVSGFVYNDLNDSGVRSANDPGLAGVLITLGGKDAQGNSVYRQVLTGADGSYHFTNLPAGTYELLEGTVAGYLDGRVSPGNLGGKAGSHLITPITLATGATAINYDFGHVAPSAITGEVYLDANKNGVLDNEFGFAHITVVLQGTDLLGQTVTRTTVSSANGTYVFADLMPGRYRVTAERDNSFFAPGNDNPGTAGGIASENTISSISLRSGTIASGYNFGEQILPGCVLDVPRDFALVEYGPHPGGVPASLLKGISFPANGPIAYYLPTLTAEVAASLRAQVIPAVTIGQNRPSGVVRLTTSAVKASSR